MSAAAPGRLGGVGLYFIDIFACTLFCLSLALVGARFSREIAIEIELPELARAGSDIGAASPLAVTLRSVEGETEIFWEDERVTFSELRTRLAAASPHALLFRMEASEFTRAVDLAHSAGVRDIQIAYEAPQSGAGDVP
jgi:biopolymer transport protein ExbD